jgi:hypothetical protein
LNRHHDGTVIVAMLNACGSEAGVEGALKEIYPPITSAQVQRVLVWSGLAGGEGSS